jgi:hypothetical protein
MYCGDLPDEAEHPAFYKRFSDHFGITIKMWKQFVADARATNSFPKRDVRSKGCGGSKIRTPLDLMVLGSLRVLCKGWGFKEVQELTFVSRQMHQTFFQEFTEYCSRVLYPAHVYYPVTDEELKNKNHEFAMAGLPNCVHDSDGCVFDWPGCPAGDRNFCCSYKGKVPAINCLLSWDHRHLVLNYTLGVGTMNDETLQPADAFLMGIFEGSIGGESTFYLASKDKHGVVTKQEYKGIYGLHDNGFLKWPTAAAVPYKHTITMSQLRFSEMLESMRKGSENGNADLKNRFLYVQHGFKQRSFEQVEHTMRTVLALHNWRKREDGLGEKWPAQKTVVGQGASRAARLSGLATRLGTNAMEVIDDGNVDPRAAFMTSIPSNGKPAIFVNESDFEGFRHALCAHWGCLWDERLIYWPTKGGPQKLQGRSAQESNAM